MDKTCVFGWIIAPALSIAILVCFVLLGIYHPLAAFRLGYLGVLGMGIFVAIRRYRNWDPMQRFDEILLVLGVACLTADIVGVL